MLKRTTNQATPTTRRQTVAYWLLQLRRKSQNLARDRKKATTVEEGAVVVATVTA